MPPDAQAALLEHGIVGTLLFLSLLALWRTNQRASETETKRVQDAQRTVEVLLNHSERVNGALAQLSAAIEHQQSAIRALEAARRR